MKAIWKDMILAESDKTIVVEGNHYFPPDSVRRELFTHSEKRSVCPWKGEAHYHTIEVNGSRNEAAAWYYPDPKSAASEIKGYVSFWKGVEVSDS